VAQVGDIRATTADVSSTSTATTSADGTTEATSTGVDEPDFGVTSAEPKTETTGIESEDIGVTGGGDDGSSSGNVETEFKVEEGEKDPVEKDDIVGPDDDSDGDGLDDDDAEDIEFTLNPDRIEASATNREDDDDDDNLDDLKLRSDGDIDGDGLNDDEEALVDEAHDKWIDVLSATWGESAGGDSFFDIFVDFDDKDTRSAVNAFLKIEGIEGESKYAKSANGDGDRVDGADDSQEKKEGPKGDKVREIVVVGIDVREAIQDGKVEVRGWDPEKKEVTMEPDDIDEAQDFLDLVGAVVLSDENIEEVSLTYTEIKVGYSQPAKLFGFFSIDMTARAEVDEAGEVKVKFPWYRFLTTNNVGELRKEMDKATPKLSEAVAGGETSVDFLRERARLFQTISDVMRAARDTATG